MSLGTKLVSGPRSELLQLIWPRREAEAVRAGMNFALIAGLLEIRELQSHGFVSRGISVEETGNALSSIMDDRREVVEYDSRLNMAFDYTSGQFKKEAAAQGLPTGHYTSWESKNTGQEQKTEAICQVLATVLADDVGREALLSTDVKPDAIFRVFLPNGYGEEGLDDKLRQCQRDIKSNSALNAGFLKGAALMQTFFKRCSGE